MTRPLNVLLVLLAIGGLLPTVTTANAQYGLDLESDTLTQSVLIHPVIETDSKRLTLWTREHTHRSNLRLGDQLARDFTVARVGDDGIPRTYRPGTNGKSNEDWFGWQKEVLAPFDGTVTRVEPPESTNAPGTMNREAQPGLIFFENDEGVTVLYVHVRGLMVEKGEHVEAGAPVAHVGNNGNSRAPHVHVSAWTGETPLQIQVDLYADKRGDADGEQRRAE